MFLDIGIGILLSIWTSCFFHSDLTFTLVFAGIAFALLPDIDFFIEFFKHGSVGGKVIREHRELTHFPIIYIPVAQCGRQCSVWQYSRIFYMTASALDGG